MKSKITISQIFAVVFLFFMLPSYGQLKYHDASVFPLLGKISEDTETRYERLPKGLKSVSRAPVWELGKNTAGLALRFRTNSTQIGVKWKLTMNRYMNHMTPAGIKGLDLYSLNENNKWEFVNSAIPNTQTHDNEVLVISEMKEEDREYMLYLPLYDGIASLEIGVDSSAMLSQPCIDLPSRNNPIIFYGTSILQGGCATRAGMAHTNIINRHLNREIINLGFSGNGQLDYEMAEIMGEREASLYVLDFMPNVNAEMVNEKMEKFYHILRRKAPNTPILFIENPIFPLAANKKSMNEAIIAKNEALNHIFKKLSTEDKNIFILPFTDMIGIDNEATVDGIHFTDLGFMRYAENLMPILKLLIKE